MLKICSLILFASLSSIVSAQTKLDKSHKWTSSTGKSVTAQLLRASDANVTLKLRNGKITNFSKKLLSAPDQELIKNWLVKNPSGYAIPKGVFKWPTLHRGKANFNIKYLRFDEGRKSHVYETKYFIFYCDEKMSDATLWSCISIFYNVVGALDSLPLHLDVIPKKGGEKYEVILVALKSNYARLGGRPNSAGFYDPRRNITVIPYGSLGIEKVDGTYKFKKGDRRYQTLIHELTHHCTYKAWRGLPCWVEEGIADHMATMPFKGSEFNLSNPGRFMKEAFLKKYRGTQVQNLIIPEGVYQAINLDYMLKVKRRQWNGLLGASLVNGIRQYDSANLMVYYFSRLDGDGSNFVKFMHAQRKDFAEGKIRDVNDFKNVKKYLLRGRTVAQLEKEMTEALAKAKILVKFKR